MPTPDRVARCPKERRPLHDLGDGTGRLHCLRCGTRYDPNDPTLDWGPPPKTGRPTIGGPTIGGLLLGADLFASLDAAAKSSGTSRNELIRCAVARYLRYLNRKDPR